MSTAASVSAAPAPTSAPGGADTTPPPRFDFPGWLPPMLVKELRQGLRQRGFVLGLIAAQTFLIVMFISGFATEVREGASRRMIDSVFWGTMFGALLLVAPLRALAALHAEIDSRTMDLLLLTRLNSWRIVWGKWVSLMVQSLLIVCSLLPYAVVRYFFGSVNIVSDLLVIGVLTVLSGMFTAAGLWMSGMNRLVRLLAMIAAVVTAFNLLNSGFMRELSNAFGIGFGSMSGGPVPVWAILAIMGTICACITAYCLMLAVRWFAPAAENHAVAARLLPLVLAAPFGVIAYYAGGRGTQGVVGLWLAGCGIIALIELASVRELLAIHLSGRLGRRGPLGWAGVLLLPGWPSAAAWVAALLATVAVGWTAVDLYSPEDYKFAQVCWLATLAWAGLVFPALLTGVLRSFSRISGAMYFVLHGLLGVCAILAGSTSLSGRSPQLMKFLDWVSHAVPTTSFWHALQEWQKPSELPGVFVGQALGVILTVGMTLWMSRAYWMNVRLMRDAARVAEQRRAAGE